MVRDEVIEFINLGPLPNSEAGAKIIGTYQDKLINIASPVTDDEATQLARMFGEDDCFGLAWVHLHLIETAPGWPIRECLEGTNEWVTRLRDRSGIR